MISLLQITLIQLNSQSILPYSSSVHAINSFSHLKYLSHSVLMTHSLTLHSDYTHWFHTLITTSLIDIIHSSVISLSLSLSIYLSIHLSVYLSICISIYLSIYLIHFYFTDCIFLSQSTSVYFISWSLIHSIHLPIDLSLHLILLLIQFIYPSIH